MTDAARPLAAQDRAGAAPTRSPESHASALRGRAAPAPTDPVDLAHWLVESFASAHDGLAAETGSVDDDGDAAGDRVAHRARHARAVGVDQGDDDDDGEYVDEENAEEDALDAPDATTTTATRSSRARTRSASTVEEDLAAVAKALELAKAAVEQLQLKMVLKANEQMEIQEQRDDKEAPQQSDMPQPTGKRHSSGELERASRAGVPLVGARVVSGATSCAKCTRYFSAFQRGRNCATCGHLFCPKCVSRQQVVPSKFGHSDRAVRVCDLCSDWLQRAMDRYFDAVDLVRRGPKEEQARKSRGHELLALRVRQKSRGPDPSVLSPKALQHQRRMEYRAQRHSIAVPDRKAKPWFSGNLRAMHVGDRLVRRRSTTELDGEGNDDGGDEDDGADNGDVSANGGVPTSSSEKPPMSAPAMINARKRATTISTFNRPPSISIDTTSGARRRSIESSDGEDANEEEEGDTIYSAGAGDDSQVNDVAESPVPSTIPDDVINVTVSRARSFSKPAEMKKATRKTKYARSASIDFASLATVCGQPPASPAASDTNESVFSGAGSVSNGELRGSLNSMKKYFDDSDIVDERRSFVGSSDAGQDSDVASDKRAAESAVDLPATVLRFAVYDIGSKESQSLKRSIVRFGRKNVMLDRYTLEVDRVQGVVRVKSVFMHRYWAFRCDSVYSVMPVGSGAIARVVVVKNGGHGHQSLEWEFGSEDDRNQFKAVIDELKSRNVSPISGKITRACQRTEDGSEVSSTTDGGGTTCSVDGITLQLPSSGLELDDKPVGSLFPLLPGEVAVSKVDVPVTFLIGPAGESSTSVGEIAMVWGRMRGFVVVTNFRVIFIHRSEQCQSFHRATAVAYIPLFAIIAAQVLFAGGRRPRSTRAFQSTAPPVVVISCKDAREMRLEVEGSPQTADDEAQYLQATINRVVDAAQRYRTVKPVDAASSSSMTLEGFEIGERAQGTLSDQYVRESLTSGSSTTHVTTSNANGSPRSVGVMDVALSPAFLPSSGASVASPVVQPLIPSSSERSDAFAFFYSIGNMRSIPDDVNGWKLYTDDREFRRQIVTDPVAQPFLKFYQNTRGNVCKSYPAKLLVPASMTSSTLMKVAEFRAKNRLPVITYYHQRNRCVLVRSGQPLLGNLLSGSSSLSDQLLLGVYRRFPEIIRTQSHSAPSSRPIYVFDARKLKASTGNRLMGKGGVETPQDYPGAVVHHLNIANMYRMQSSYQALLKLVMPGGVDDQDKAWLSSMEATRWLSHVRQVLEGAVKIARVLELEGSSVLVHCSDGWDRTAQLTALAQIMIDPYFRTIRGFAVVVEKDWCAFGHKFAERLGGDRNKDPQRSKSSPVMFQFLDAVWQMLRQFPTAFEFDERFLLHIANALTSGLYGTFLYDSRFDRDANDVKNCTVSVWTPVLMTPEAFRNANYEPMDTPIWPWTSTQMVRLWEAYFFQWHSKYYGCRWTASLVHHHHHQNNTNGISNGAKGDEVQPRNASLRSVSMDDSGLSIPTGTAPHTPASSSGAARERQSSGDLSVNGTMRSGRQQPEKKSPPMHKIFLFKS